jgi:hypothetical protein
MAGLFFGICFATQLTSALISEPGKAQKQRDADNAICDKIKVTNTQIDAINTLRVELAGAKAVEPDTASKIISLNSTISAEIASMNAEKKKFSIKIFISIITNIIITAILGIFLFS